MPPRTRLSPLAFRPIASDSYVCPSCRNQAILRPSAAVLQSRQPQLSRNASTSRWSSTHTQHATRPVVQSKHLPIGSKRRNSNGALASRTAVNAPLSVPLDSRELHQLLLLLQDTASSYVDLSRMQLALRSLESSDPVIRVAFLGLGSNGLQAARKLARVLLSDALGSEEEWEKELLTKDDSRGVLLRYGDWVDPSGVQGGTPVLRTLTIPSLFLQKYNLEIMITPLNANSNILPNPENTKDLVDTILVPPLTMPNSAGGRVGFVRYPVHSALIIAEGINGAVEYGRFPAALSDELLINSALSLPLRSSTGLQSSEESVTENAVDIDLAEHALGIFRASNVNGAQFGREWQTSRVGTIANWLSASTNAATSNKVKPAVAALIESILVRSADRIVTTESAQVKATTSLSIPDAKRTSLQSSLAEWAEEAHRDLQVNLATALSSPTWRRTAWWRLFWRIDEVSLSASDVLRRGWLVEAEQNLAFLSGRAIESGVATAAQLKFEPAYQDSSPASTSPLSSTPENPSQPPTTGLLDESMRKEVTDYQAAQLPSSSPRHPQQSATVAELMQLPPMLARVHAQSGLNALFDPPWPPTITLARQRLLHTHVPALHRAAQILLLRTLSTIGGSGALAAWLWVASGGVAFYEAGAVAALGLVWGLRRLQTQWRVRREAFATTAREDGRRVLADVETRVAALVRDGGRVEVPADDRRAWRRARQAIEACAAALEKVRPS